MSKNFYDIRIPFANLFKYFSSCKRVQLLRELPPDFFVFYFYNVINDFNDNLETRQNLKDLGNATDYANMLPFYNNIQKRLKILFDQTCEQLGISNISIISDIYKDYLDKCSMTWELRRIAHMLL